MDTERLKTLAKEYRATMDKDIVHSWAADVVAVILPPPPAVKSMPPPKPQEPALPGAEWVRWRGGECPVHPETKVHFRTMAELIDPGAYINEDTDGRKAGTLRWVHKNAYPLEHPANDDIVAYRVVSTTAALKMADLTTEERLLVKWLGEEDFSQYGECKGSALDRLVVLGWAQVHGVETETQNSFIAKGRGIDYRAVSLTDAALAALVTDKG